MKQHNYEVRVEWTGNDGEGTKTYKSYRRDHIVACEGKPPIHGSSDPSFRGDRTRYNPEELLVASLCSCHMLWYLHLCSVNRMTVLDYRDHAFGIMEEHDDGSGEFVLVTLRPIIRVPADHDQTLVIALHDEAHRLCFIARSVKFPVRIASQVEVVP